MKRERKTRIRRAAKLYQDFQEKQPKHLDKVSVPEYEVYIRIGECTHIAYIAEDGKNYIHKFRKSSRPILIVSDDGKQLALIGGKYRFTERGIMDV